MSEKDRVALQPLNHMKNSNERRKNNICHIRGIVFNGSQKLRETRPGQRKIKNTGF